MLIPTTYRAFSQRFSPEKEPSKGEHRGFDILVPTGTAMLVVSDGRSQITCYDRARVFPASSTACTYPVPWQGLDRW